MNSEIERKNLVLKDKYKKINDSLKIVGLSKIDINRNIITLSESEKKLVQIAIALLSNPDIIVFEEPFIKLDLKNQKRIIMFFGRIKEKFKDDKQKALEYFLNTGIEKGQVASPVFDINYYINHNSDLKEKFGNDLEKYYKHFE